MLKANLLWSCGVCFFIIFRDCLRIFVMFVNVGMWKTVLIEGESTVSEAVFVGLLNYFCEVLTIFLGCIRMYVWWRFRGTTSGEREGVGSPLPFFEKWKKTTGLSLMCRRWNVYRNAFILRNLPCPVKILIPQLCIVFTPDKQTDFHVMPTWYRIGSCCISRTYPI